MLSTRSREMYRIHATGGCRVAFYFLRLPVPSRVRSLSHTLKFFETFREVDLAPLSTRGQISHKTPLQCTYTYTPAVGEWRPCSRLHGLTGTRVECNSTVYILLYLYNTLYVVGRRGNPIKSTKTRAVEKLSLRYTPTASYILDGRREKYTVDVFSGEKGGQQ